MVGSWLSRNWLWLVTTGLGWALAAFLALREGQPIPPLPPIPQQAAPDGDAPPPEYVAGWTFDPEAVAVNLDPEKTQQFEQTPAGRAALGDEDVFLWQAVRKVNNRGPPWYPNVNQRDVGCCVGCGWKHAADVCLATQIVAGSREQWKAVAVEPIYAGSRVEVGGGRIRGDGSIGAWAKDWCRNFGLIPMEGPLAEFSPARARAWGRSGVPDDLEPLARQHPVKDTALVKSWSDVKRAIPQGYPVAVCSDQGFTMSRDKDGFASPRGTWAHCMAIIGVRGGDRPGAFVLNSWGDSAHTGPVWPADAPVAGFWADANVIDRMVRQGDSFALSGAVGFKARRLDWNVQRVEPAGPPRAEVVLAW